MFHTVSTGAIMLTSNPNLFLTVIIKTAVSWASVTSLYNRLFNALGSSRMRHTILPLKIRSKNLTRSKGLRTPFERALTKRCRDPTAQCSKDRLHWRLRQNRSVAAHLTLETIKAAISLLPFTHLFPSPQYLRYSLPEGPRRSPAGRQARAGLGAPPPPSRPAPPGPAAARQRRLFGPRTLARTRSSRPRHVPGGGGGGSPTQGAVAGVAPLSPPPPPSAASLAPSASCAVAPRDSWRDRGRRGGPAPGPLTACHRQPGGASRWT